MPLALELQCLIPQSVTFIWSMKQIRLWELFGINSSRITEYSADVLSEVFGFGDMEYFAGIKLFNEVSDRLGVDMDQQRRYEVFDRIYEEGMRDKKFERDGNSR